MNKVRERILKEVENANYVDFSKHKDLIAFCICDGFFGWNPVTYEEEEADFNELIVVVEKDWLFNHIKMGNRNIVTDEDARKFLQEEYTSDDSSEWYDAAIMENKVVMVDFN
jgi:hypothetical protein|nr:MAG TPA: hypothetical protein [Bacteriophage sp.]